MALQGALESPATHKTTELGGNDRLSYAIIEMQGWRDSMEDSHAAVLELDKEKSGNVFFAVYDGHTGGEIAKYASQNLHKSLVSEELYSAKEYEKALKRAFLGTDEDILANPNFECIRGLTGCTALATLMTNDKIYVANAGDSRSVISVKGKVKALSDDHKPFYPSERIRIQAAGGKMEFDRIIGADRIIGNRKEISFSRAIGDFDFKESHDLPPENQIVTSNPDVTVHNIDEEDEFLVLACDGIWDCLSSQEVVDFIRMNIAEGKELTRIGEMMCDLCLSPRVIYAGTGCDNMTILIIALFHGRTKEEWYAWIKERVDHQYGYPTPSVAPQPPYKDQYNPGPESEYGQDCIVF